MGVSTCHLLARQCRSLRAAKEQSVAVQQYARTVMSPATEQQVRVDSRTVVIESAEAQSI